MTIGSKTVGDVLRELFRGEQFALQRSAGNDKIELDQFESPASFPTDVFAAAALLLTRAGALNWLLISSLADLAATVDPPEPVMQAMEHMGAASKLAGYDLLDVKTLDEFRKCGVSWREEIQGPPPLVAELWDKLLSERDKPIKIYTCPPFPTWWIYAVSLLMISDEAALGLGYDDGKNWLGRVFYNKYAEIHRKALDAAEKGKTTITLDGGLCTFCVFADPDVACVLPKVRTPGVGCTLRSYTHNLALLPPRGIMEGYWEYPPAALKSEDSATLNLLIIPYPYRLRARWFKQARVVPQKLESETDRWGWFEIEQKWLIADVIEFTEQLILAAEKDSGQIHGLLFPELALNWKIFDGLVSAINAKFPEVEFIVSGSSSNCANEKGNFVLSAVFHPVKQAIASATPTSAKKPVHRQAFIKSQAKHHRWRLDETQISNYALGSSLDPRMMWWEAIQLEDRELHVNVFRQSSAFATLICEDLARSDPCHAVLRDLGPNLVFVMLMDGPQLKERWAARYATTLADDPGSSVLTYTSLGLINRTNNTSTHKSSDIMALWKDDQGKTVHIRCPADAHGVVLTLSGARVTEHTLDGRDAEARAWRFHSQQPVSVDSKEMKIKDLVDRLVNAGWD